MATYIASTSDERFDPTYSSSDVDNAIALLVLDDKLSVGDTVFVGEAKDPPKLSDLLNFSSIIDDASEEAFEQCGYEDFDSHFTKEQQSDFEEMLKAAADKWAKKHKLEPTFFSVDNTETFTVKEHHLPSKLV